MVSVALRRLARRAPDRVRITLFKELFVNVAIALERDDGVTISYEFFATGYRRMGIIVDIRGPAFLEIFCSAEGYGAMSDYAAICRLIRIRRLIVNDPVVGMSPIPIVRNQTGTTRILGVG